MQKLFDYRRAVKLQKILSEKALLSIDNPPRLDHDKIEYVAGVDASYHKGTMYGVAVLIDYKSKKLVEYSVVKKKPPIPYVPGLLAFREAPAYIVALAKLNREPDIVFVDGHGLSHPRGLGIATHIGLVLEKPSIGIAKKKLYGKQRIINGEKYLEAHGKLVARVIEHRNHELYISIGYKISLEDAYKLTISMVTPKYKLPLPTALADIISKRIAHSRTR